MEANYGKCRYSRSWSLLTRPRQLGAHFCLGTPSAPAFPQKMSESWDIRGMLLMAQKSPLLKGFRRAEGAWTRRDIS